MQRSTFNVLATLAFLATIGGGTPASADEGHSPIPPDKMLELEPQVVEIDDFEAQGPILAIGGGGECVIGQLKGDQVVAIDISRRELEDAPGEALKIVMDARDMKFVAESFEVAASFFTLMYIDGSDHRKVFEEVFRVLEPGGRFLVWDAVLGPPAEAGKTVVVVPLTVKLPDREIRTGYGVRFPDRPHDLSHYKGLATAVGFELVSERTKKHWFHLMLRKPEQ